MEAVAYTLIRIVGDDLDKQLVAALLEFLASKLQNRAVQHGSVITLDDARARDVKFLLRKFLYSNGLSNYKILSHEGVLEIVRVKQPDQNKARQEGLKPSMPGPIAGIPHTVQPSDTIEWSSHPWKSRSSRKKN